GFNVFLLCLAAEQDHSSRFQSRVGLDRCQHFEAAEAWHLYVEQDERRLVPLDQRPRLIAISGLFDVVVVGVDGGVDEQAHAGLVISDQDGTQSPHERRDRVRPHTAAPLGAKARAINAAAACGPPASFGRTASTPEASRAEISLGAMSLPVSTTTGR